ncbi:hypothetical protein VNO80_22770 [Phaseolus coccineus]|uniref:Uncharacterized protein n=1 Tax=Phaseolus coccineus TaxID=3886 RepID=A0AAN9M4Q6_PHACN
MKEKLTDQRDSGLQMEAAREGSSGTPVVDAQMLREEDDEQTTLESLLACIVRLKKMDTDKATNFTNLPRLRLKLAVM